MTGVFIQDGLMAFVPAGACVVGVWAPPPLPPPPPIGTVLWGQGEEQKKGLGISRTEKPHKQKTTKKRNKYSTVPENDD